MHNLKKRIILILFVALIIFSIVSLMKSENFEGESSYAQPRGQVLSGDGWTGETKTSLVCPKGNFLTVLRPRSSSTQAYDVMYNCSIEAPNDETPCLDKDITIIRRVPILAGNKNKWMLSLARVPFCNGNVTARQNTDFNMEYTCT